MQFIDAVRQQMRPLQALPAPDRIIDLERHISPATLPRPAARRTQIRLPPGKSARPAKLALLRPRRQEGTRLKRAPLRARHICVRGGHCVRKRGTFRRYRR